MNLTSLEELECLLSPQDRAAFHEDKERQNLEKTRKQEAAYAKYDGRPERYQTSRRVIPRLPKWMRDRIIEAREIYDHYDDGGWGATENVWNHVITLSLDNKHTVTFTLLEVPHNPRSLNHDIKTMIAVYKELQILYREYGNPLSIISIWSAEGGMSLPNSFYTSLLSKYKIKPSITEGSAIEVFKQLYPKPCVFDLGYMESVGKDYSDSLDGDEKNSFKAWFENEFQKRVEYIKELDNVLKESKYDYRQANMWDNIELYMETGFYGRELCVKWNIEQNIENVKKLDSLRPLIDGIIRKSGAASLAFGVKPIHAEVTPCYRVR